MIPIKIFSNYNYINRKFIRVLNIKYKGDLHKYIFWINIFFQMIPLNIFLIRNFQRSKKIFKWEPIMLFMSF